MVNSTEIYEAVRNGDLTPEQGARLLELRRDLDVSEARLRATLRLAAMFFAIAMIACGLEVLLW